MKTSAVLPYNFQSLLQLKSLFQKRRFQRGFFVLVNN